MPSNFPPPTATSGSTSSSLIERVKACDPAAWTRLVELYSPLVYRWSRAAGVPMSDAPDVVQEVFQSVSTHVTDFRRRREGDSFRGWLWTITRNKSHDYFRGRAHQPEARGGATDHERLLAVPQPEPELPESWDADAAVAAEAHNLLLHRALDLVRAEFAESTWRAFWRTTVEKAATADVAAELDLSAGAVRQAKYRVLRRLRQELAE
ncbi:MAG TPA: RNA polymerase sigma factor [Pirellulales bacterium]|nr:RNA polymerase sigma factor [Pirellulales bacterium]